jgi:hypothetical protein
MYAIIVTLGSQGLWRRGVGEEERVWKCLG